MSGRSLRPRRKAAGQSVLKSNLSHSSQIRKTSRSRSQPRNIEKLQKKGKISVGTIMIDSDCDSDTEVRIIFFVGICFFPLSITDSRNCYRKSKTGHGRIG